MTIHSKPPLSTQFEKADVEIQLPMTYLHFNPGKDKPLLLLFHGYEDTAAGVLRRTLTGAEHYSKFEILAPNGLFPLPVRIEQGWKQSFAWYFSDFARKHVLIPPTVAALAVARLLQQLGLEKREKLLIGFSQGGFFLPFLLPHVKNIKKLIAVGAGYREEDYPAHLPIPLDALHGETDQIIPLEKAKEGFQKLKIKNPQGQFYSFAGLGHSMNAESRAYLKKIILGAFP
ncbi:MAG: alpha/beta hydrolase [Pseudobdellovibrionaceae bacterium]